VLTGIFVFLGLSFLILAHEAGHFFVAKLFKLKIDEFGFGFPPRMFARKYGETEYSMNWLPFGGFVKIAGESDQFDETAHKEIPPEEEKRFFRTQSAPRRAAIMVAGVAVNFLIGWILLSAIFMIGTPVVITGVVPDSSADTAGILSGDVVQGFSRAEEFSAFIHERQGVKVPLMLLRDGKEIRVIVTPRVLPKGERGALGVSLSGIARESFFASIREGFMEAMQIAKLTLVGFWQLFAGLLGQGKLVEGIVGPVGIFGVAVSAGKAGFIFVFHLLALISVNLAVVNLIPFPALDGGRLMLVGIEKMKGSRLSKKVEIGINAVGFGILILLMVLITIRDILTL